MVRIADKCSDSASTHTLRVVVNCSTMAAGAYGMRPLSVRGVSQPSAPPRITLPITLTV